MKLKGYGSPHYSLRFLFKLTGSQRISFFSYYIIVKCWTQMDSKAFCILNTRKMSWYMPAVTSYICHISKDPLIPPQFPLMLSHIMLGSKFQPPLLPSFSLFILFLYCLTLSPPDDGQLVILVVNMSVKVNIALKSGIYIDL